MKITAKDFEAYEDVRKSGATNMFMVSTVCDLSGLEREQVKDIMSNYSEYQKKFGEKANKSLAKQKDFVVEVTDTWRVSVRAKNEEDARNKVLRMADNGYGEALDLDGAEINSVEEDN